jgi:hypothetical protein
MNEPLKPNELLRYRGSPKHKNRPTGERKGTLCPDWTHSVEDKGYQSDPFSHDWARTMAYKLFENAELSLDGRRRFATLKGIAFEAKPTQDGTWHGYPVPWESIPHDLLQRWLGEGSVSRRQIKQHFSKGPDDLRWAMEADAP